MKPQEMIDVIQAHADGKQIEFRETQSGMRWTDCAAPIFNFARFEYRVKPAAPAMWQYYWKNAACCAVGASDANCKCWWDEGTGQLPYAKYGDKNIKWRPAPATLRPHWPAPATLRPHWPALLECRGIDYPVVGDTVFATEIDARKYYNPPSVKVIRLATEYPPVMLP